MSSAHVRDNAQSTRCYGSLPVEIVTQKKLDISLSVQLEMSGISISEVRIIAPRSRRFSARIHGLAFCRAAVLPLGFRVTRAGSQALDPRFGNG